MSFNVSFKHQALEALVGGQSPLDFSNLSVGHLDGAHEFLLAYGYDVELPEDLKVVEMIHRQAVALLRDKLLDEGEELPKEVYDPQSLEDIGSLFVYASNLDGKYDSIQPWACALLKVMHVFAHLENDIFHLFPQDIKTQLIRPFQSFIYEDSVTNKSVMGSEQDGEKIVLERFEIKPTKSLTSSVIKLLAKRDMFAMTLLDKVGVRFVTRNVFDSFRVLRFLHEHSLVSFPNSIVDQVTNTIYPVNLFFEAMDELRSRSPMAPLEEIDEVMERKLDQHFSRAEFVEKENIFSGDSYRFMKFISRKLIRINMPEGRQVRFFYPFEVQIMDYDTYLKNLQGPQSHKSYKERQRMAARRRIFGFKG